jgi:uncharacterized iron-regulated protein
MRASRLPYRPRAALSAILLVGCGSAPSAAVLSADAGAIDRVEVARGSDGSPLSWAELVEHANAADIVLLGEVHGHPTGLAAAAQLFEEMAAEERPALGLEFFERDDQAGLDAYLSGATDEPAFRQATGRTEANYPPGHRAMIETAKLEKLPVFAANAPRRYAKTARLEGYDPLRSLPPEEQRLFTIPDELPGGRYRTAFSELMGGGGHGAAHEAGDYFLAQALWDATMADSVVDALERHGPPVLLVAGRFHIDHDGGLVQLVRDRAPDARLLTISVIDASPGPITAEDAGRADVLLYVGGSG